MVLLEVGAMAEVVLSSVECVEVVGSVGVKVVATVAEGSVDLEMVVESVEVAVVVGSVDEVATAG